MKLHQNIPEEIDYNQFKWLTKGDRLAIAQKTGVGKSMVYHTLKRRAFNLDVLYEAMRMVVVKKKKLLELQLESQQLSQALQLKVA